MMKIMTDFFLRPAPKTAYIATRYKLSLVASEVLMYDVGIDISKVQIKKYAKQESLSSLQCDWRWHDGRVAEITNIVDAVERKRCYDAKGLQFDLRFGLDGAGCPLHVANSGTASF